MITVTRPVHFRTRGHGRRVASTKPSPLTLVPARVPRIARLMALAIKFDGMLRRGEAKSLGELARRHQISQPRATQLLNLTLLAPDIQESLLFLPPTERGRDSVIERELRPVSARTDWQQQRSRNMS